VVDKDFKFREVEISPRWYFAGINKTKVTIGYGSDGNQVGYDYKFNSQNNSVEIITKGEFDKFTLRIPLPDKTKSASASLNGKNTVVKIEQVNNSRYAVITGSGNNNTAIFIFK
jgi:hypothetical protein